MPRRIAYVVLPTYQWSELGGDPTVVSTLMRLNVLKPELPSRQEDADAYRRALQSLGFEVTCSASRLDSNEFEEELKTLVEMCSDPDDVFVLVFSGYGQQKGISVSKDLLFSDNSTSYALDALLAPAASRASVFMVCELKEHSAAADNRILSMENILSMEKQRRVEVFCTSHVKSTSQGCCSPFARAFAQVLTSPETPGVETLEASLASAMSTLCEERQEKVKVYRHNLMGPSFGALQERPTPPGLFVPGDSCDLPLPDRTYEIIDVNNVRN